MELSVHDLARMMDLSAVRTDVDYTEIERLAAEAKRFGVICAFVMPCYALDMKRLLEDAPEVGVGSVAGFPSGATATASKAAEAHDLVLQGVDEVDMVINVGWLKSGRDDAVRDDIRAVVEAAQGTPVKSILECHYLSEDEMRRGAELAVEAGVSFVKTGTGWAPTGATLANVQLLKSVVGDRAGVKAAGGVRDLETVVEMMRRGVTRFGISAESGAKILGECAARPGGVVTL
ncbi:MAG: deoxyribose-phosphate aldolase [bacterium]|nr:deoxyribose-phosphate aldolase [bacterium]